MPISTVRVVSAVTDVVKAESVTEDDCATIEDDDELDSVGVDDDCSDSDDDETPITMRVARYLESGKPSGPKKRKRAKLNHLSSEQKVERR